MCLWAKSLREETTVDRRERAHSDDSKIKTVLTALCRWEAGARTGDVPQFYNKI